jgi:hypothetical protein
MLWASPRKSSNSCPLGACRSSFLRRWTATTLTGSQHRSKPLQIKCYSADGSAQQQNRPASLRFDHDVPISAITMERSG